MIKRLIPLLILILTACTPSSTVTPPTLTQTSQPVSNVLVIAHRGGAGLMPENTLAAFKNGIALKSDFIEMDAHLTKDGIPVIIHDATLERTTDGFGSVSNFTLAQLQTYNAAAKSLSVNSKEQIPTFAQVLDLAKPANIKVEVEIKVPPQGRHNGIEQKMIDEIVARDMIDRVQISSFNMDVIKEVKALNPKIKPVALMSVDFFRIYEINTPKTIVDHVTSLGAEIIAVNKDYLNAKLVQEARARKVVVEVWTVDNESDIKKFVAMGVDGIISNRPDKLKETIGK
jgi:glycerophosphoryl diester phosphodiesterase